MNKITSLLSISAAALWLSAAPACSQVAPLQVIVAGEVPLESTGNKAVLAGLGEAEKAAMTNAWIVIKRHPDIGLRVRNLTIEQNAVIAQGLKQRCQTVMLNHEVDKKLKRLTARYRFDCNLLDVQMDIDALMRTAAAPQAAARPRLATFFLVKEVASLTSYDPNIDRSAKATARVGATQSGSANVSYKSDTRSRQTSTEGYGEGGASVTDTLSTRDQEKGRAQVSASATAQVAVTEEATFKAQGRTINQAAEQTYRSASPEELNANLTDVFKNAGARINHYADISGSCPGPNPDAVTRDFGNKSEDLSTPVRNGIQSALRACGFRYMMLGDALVDTSQPDPVTGNPKVSIVLRAKIWDIGETFPEVVATVQKSASSTTNPNINIARGEAMFQVSQRVGEEALSRLSAEGVR